MQSVFFMKKYPIILIVLIVAVLTSCSEYQKLLKTNDPELKYNKAVEFFEKGDFMRASTLFDEVSMYFRGTDKAETLLNYIARSYMGQKDYYSASEYYRTYVRTYPKGQFTTEAKFMIGYCFYLESPDVRLDQTATFNAIEAFQEFIDIYPESERVPEANKLLDELNDKLAEKYLLNARLYFNLGNYLGNNYLSAVITAQNALRRFPATKYREDFGMLILDSKYQQAVMSFENLKIDRYRDVIDDYYNFINDYPAGKFRRQADRIFNESKKIVKD